MCAGSPWPGRPFIGVHFRCCNVYARVYRRAGEAAYEGRCPRCLRPLRVGVGTGGVEQRIFQTAS